MNTPLEVYFDKIFVINLARRTDRWDHVLQQMATLGITEFERFEAYDRPIDHHGKPNGNMGCTSSHRALFELIAYFKWQRVLIFEDDFALCVDRPQEMFQRMIHEVPLDWEMLYLGGHYGEPPVARVSPHVIKMGRMLTTSSYGITAKFAREIAPYINGVGPIDSLLSGWHRERKCYITQPRLFVQYPSFSDLTDTHSSNHQCMMDRSHEQMV